MKSNASALRMMKSSASHTEATRKLTLRQPIGPSVAQGTALDSQRKAKSICASFGVARPRTCISGSGTELMTTCPGSAVTTQMASPNAELSEQGLGF